MAKRKLQLPGEEDFNKDQDKVLAIPEDGQYLIVGGPGTGKSVVALQRVLKFMHNNNYIFLVYNKVLESLTLQLVNTNIESATLVSFFYKLHWQLFQENVPNIKPFEPDYDLIVQTIRELDCEPTPVHLIIDEGQDMPPQFYEALQYAGYEHFFIVADQNQQITETKSSRADLTDLLGLEVEDVIELTTNYRNTRPIATLAHCFFTDPSSPPPELPENDSLETPTIYENIDNTTCFEMILREADKDDRNLIGVVVATNQQRTLYLDNLTTIEIKLDNPKPIISSYESKDKNNSIDFTQGGIVILNDKSVKGLEFDIVFIVLDGFKIYNNDIDNMKKRFYVMCSRAIKKLIILRGNGTQKEIAQLFRIDEKVLRRMNLAKHP